MSGVNLVQLQNQLSLARREINNLRQQLSTLTHVHKKEIANVNQKLETWQCQECKKTIKDTTLNKPTVNPSTNSCSDEFDFKPIGVINTYFPEKRGTPRQPGICKDLKAKLTLDKNILTNPSHALEGLEEFSHMWILFYFHKNESTHVKAKVAPPRLNGIRTGVFATRSPHRPCPIGLSLVKIDRIIGDVIYFNGVDMVDQTPVFDIKPYIPLYDNPVYPIPSSNVQQDTPQRGSIPSSSANSSLTENVTSLDGLQSPTDSRTERDIDVGIPPREMDGQENGGEGQILDGTESDISANEITYYRRSSSRIGEREAPDGEEEEPPTGTQRISSAPSTSLGHVRVPSWIDRAPVVGLTVTFKDRALAQLSQLGAEGEEKKKTITNVLQEDPRSVYLRERWSGHCYVFRIAELYVSCKFNDSNHSVTVYQIIQHEGQTEGDE